MNAAIADLQTVSAGSSYDANKQSADHSHVVVDSLRTQLKVRPPHVGGSRKRGVVHDLVEAVTGLFRFHLFYLPGEQTTATVPFLE